jgi:hypothetical protein
MSFKLYEAYRLKPGVDLWEFVHDVRIKAQRRAGRILRTVYTSLLQDAETNKKMREEILKAYSQGREIPDRPVGAVDCACWVREKYKQASISPRRDKFDLDVSISFRKYKRHWYIIPFPGSGLFNNVLSFMRKDPRLEEYHYQNQTDKSAKYSNREWGRRRKIWFYLMDYLKNEDREGDQLCLAICKHDMFTKVDPSLAMFQERHKRKRRKKK